MGNNWNTAANWSGSAVPGAGDTAVFDGTSSKPVTINVNVSLSGAGGGLTRDRRATAGRSPRRLA